MKRRNASVDAVELLKQHRRLTRRLAGRLGRFDAEDLASEALARTLRRPAPDGEGAPWLERILRNLQIDRARRARRCALNADHLSRATAVTVPSPEDELLSAERRRAVQAALPAMPLPLRDALMGRFYEGQDYDAVAAAGGVSVAAARTRVHRALACLRVALGRLRSVPPVPLSQVLGASPASLTGVLLPAALVGALVMPAIRQAPASGMVAPVVAPPAVVAPRVSRWARSGGAAVVSAPDEARAPATVPAHSQQVRPASAPAERRSELPPSSRRAETAPAPPVQRYDYDDDEVEGALARPDGDGVRGDPAPAAHPSLIEIRTAFVPEILKMVEDL